MADEERPYDPSRDATAQEPLTANEKKLVTRLFGDPFAFPLEFKAWLRGWLEEQFPRIGSLTVAAETGAAGAFVPPAGAILDYAGTTVPNGYVLCDGAEYDRTALAYQRLFAAIGTTYGAGSGGNMFQVPDLQGRVAVGRGTHPDVDAMADSDGLAVGTRSIKHGHIVQHWTQQAGGSETSFTFSPSASETVDGTARIGPVGTPEDGPAYLVVNKIISLGS